ncbi:MAG: Rieske 2Fe-2S domain-containing protein [Planctomycetota bacterium]|nr:Rieske 2Fe-2S domain-containing protein [Planctomycetota bacterium]
MAKKPNTDDILSKIRRQGADAPGGDADAAPPEDAAAPAEKPKAASSGGPADIMAKIRAQGAGGEAGKPADEQSPAKKAALKSPADIMAAIRSQGGSGAASAKPEGTSPAKKAAAVSAPVGDLPPVDEMLRQMKTGKVGSESDAAPVKPKLQIPVRPVKKAAAAAKSSRRGFLSWFAAAWVLLTATSAAWVLGLARFMFPNVLVEPPSQFKVGSPSDYPLGTVSTKYTASNGIWLVHTDQYKGKSLIYALASVCTHLGCTPSWLEGEQKFKCPCHGSGFYMTGINFEGPAPRPLERVGLSIAPDGMLEVDKSVKFQEEKGQWEDSKSYVDASLV